MKDKKEDDIVGVWMNMKTNLKNIDGFFDYNSSQIKCFNVFAMKNSKFVCTENNNIKCYKYLSEISENGKLLFAID